MTVAVIGGTGMVGAEVVRRLTENTDDRIQVRILSRRPPAIPIAGAVHHPIDLHSREGLTEALSGVDTVIDVGNERRAAKKVLVDGTGDLLERCRVTGIDHYVGISIIGCERMGMGYYVAKAAQEEVIKKSPIGWSLIRASQFHELLDSVFAAAGRFRFSPTGSVPLQTISASAVARKLAEVALAGPTGATEQMAGPQVESLTEMSRAWRQAESKRCIPVRLWIPGKNGRALRDGALTDPASAVPGPTFSEWLATRGG